MANTLVKGLAIGCGALALLGVGLMVVGGLAFTRFGNEIQKEASKPLDKAALMAALGDTPIYPGAQLDETATQGASVAKKIFGYAMKDPVVAGLKLPGQKEEAAAWYEKTLPTKGYTKTAAQHFNKGTRELMVIPSETSGGDFITLIVGEAK